MEELKSLTVGTSTMTVPYESFHELVEKKTLTMFSFVRQVRAVLQDKTSRDLRIQVPYDVVGGVASADRVLVSDLMLSNKSNEDLAPMLRMNLADALGVICAHYRFRSYLIDGDVHLIHEFSDPAEFRKGEPLYLEQGPIE